MYAPHVDLLRDKLRKRLAFSLLNFCLLNQWEAPFPHLPVLVTHIHTGGQILTLSSSSLCFSVSFISLNWNWSTEWACFSRSYSCEEQETAWQPITPLFSLWTSISYTQKNITGKLSPSLSSATSQPDPVRTEQLSFWELCFVRCSHHLADILHVLIYQYVVLLHLWSCRVKQSINCALD